MATIPAGELTSLRTTKHAGTAYLNVLKPTTILAARVNNGAITRGARTIAYDGGSGTYSLIRSYQELWVGTAAGKRDLGRVKIVSISGTAVSGTITIAENGIAWADDLYLTIKHDYPIYPEQPRIDGSGIFYKRYSTTYTDQNSEPPPVCLAGPDQVETLPTPVTGSIAAQVSAGADDGYVTTGGAFNPNLAFALFGDVGSICSSWIRVTANIPQGATINSAIIEFVPTENDSDAVNVDITAEAADNPTAPASQADFAGRTRTTAVSWSPGAWVDGVTTQSLDISSVIQEVVDRPGFVSGNAIQLFLDYDSGVGERFFATYDANPDQAPILRVSYTTLVQAIFNFDLSDSYAVADGATIPATGAYALSVAPSTAATVSFNVDTGVGTVTVTSASHWWVTASVTDSNGKSQERFVWITTETPYRDFTISGWSETWGQGVRCSVNVHGDVTQADFPDEALCILWYDNKFDDVSGYVNILADDYDNLFTVGYIRNENSTDDISSGSHEVTFDITTIDDLLNNVPMMPISIEAVATPAYWYQYARWLTVGRAIHHLLLWHSDIMHRVDYIGGVSNTLRLKEAKFEEGALFQQANRLAYDQGILAKLTCDRFNRLHLVADSQMLNTAARAALDTVFSIDEADASGHIDFTRNTEQRTYITQLSGFYFDGSDSVPYVSLIPGYQESTVSYSIPERRGSSLRNWTGQVLASQTDSNEKTGRVHADDNREIDRFTVPFRGNYIGALSTVPSYGWYGLDIANTTLARQLQVNGMKLLCRQINLSYVPGDFSVEAVFEPEATGPDGIPGNYPTTMPAVPVPQQPRWQESELEALFAFSSASYRDDNDSDWEELQTVSYLHGGIDRWWSVKRQTSNPEQVIWWAVAAGKVYRVVGKDGTPDERTPVSDPPNTHSDAVAPTMANLTPVQYLSDPFREDRHYVLWQWQEAGGNWRGWISVTDDDGLTWTWLALYDGVTLPDQIKPLWMAVNGTYLLVTVWADEATDILKLVTFDSEALTYSDEFSLGACSLVELPETYYAFPVTVLDDDDTWYVAGRMNAPQALANPEHIITTANAGAAWASEDNGHSTKRVLGLSVTIATAGDRDFDLIVGN